MKRASQKGGVALLAMTIALAGLAGCKAKRTYPEPNVGWHSPSYSVLFGRIRRAPGATPDSLPIWVLRFGDASDAYGGELALSPPEKLAGYSGGENVEVHGHLLTDKTNDAFSGRWYVVDSIQYWSGYQ
jgi:hypothetical protein